MNLHSSGLVLPGFDHISRVWDESLNVVSARILPGEYYVTREDEMITTVLGSCISVCVSDLENGIGGMNHFLLPDSSETGSTFGVNSTRYGLHAMDRLVDTILNFGGARENLVFKVFGGGKMMPTMGDIGGTNIEFTRRYLHRLGFAIAAEDVGSVYPREVNYYPLTGKVMLKRLRPLHNKSVADKEQALMRG